MTRRLLLLFHVVVFLIICKVSIVMSEEMDVKAD